MSIATASDFEAAPAPARPSVTPFLLAAAGVALADWLFYGWDVGISLALFLALPCGKFVHGVYRSAALVKNALEQSRAEATTGVE